jgi:hypothetical protein
MRFQSKPRRRERQHPAKLTAAKDTDGAAGRKHQTQALSDG